MPSDEELVRAVRGGDAAAANELARRYQDRVFNMCYRSLLNREEAADTAQEVFMSAFRAIDKFDQRARFSTWLYRITRNRCLDQIRRRGFKKYQKPVSLNQPLGASEDRPSLEPADPEATPVEAAEQRERGTLVMKALGEMTPDVREILVLREIQGLSYDEVAQILEVPVGTVRSRLSRARMLLRDKLLPMLEKEE